MKLKKCGLPLLVSLALLSGPVMATPFLGQAQNFAVLGGSMVTDTGPSSLYGNLGAMPGTVSTGLGSINVTGTLHQADAIATQAQADALTAYNILAGKSVTNDLSGIDLGGLTLTPGVYYFSTSAQLTGNLILDANHDLNALFIFQIGTALTTASGADVSVINGAASSGVFWQIGSSATLGTGTNFAGNIIADQSITLNSAADILCGRAIALHGAVTLDTNIVSNDCTHGAFGSGQTDYGSGGFSALGGGIAPVTEPGTLALAAVGLLGLLRVRSRKGQNAQSADNEVVA